jgi:hypothetical protein
MMLLPSGGVLCPNAVAAYSSAFFGPHAYPGACSNSIRHSAQQHLAAPVVLVVAASHSVDHRLTIPPLVF